MDQGRDDRPGRGLGNRFPRIAVATVEELTAVLEQWRQPLVNYARRYLRDPAEAAAAVNRTAARLRRRQHPATPHALRSITTALWKECHATLDRWQREGIAPPAEVPVDRFLGAVEGGLAEAVAKLPASEREIFLAIARNQDMNEAARQRGVSPAGMRVTLHRARKRLRTWREEGRFQWGVVAIPLRARAALTRWVRALGDAVPHPASALVPVVASSLWWTATGPSSPPAPVVDWGLTAAVTLTAVTVPPPGLASTPVASGVGRVAMPSAESRHFTTTSALRGAAAETPDDVRLTAAATPPGTSSAVVAIGHGAACDCPVLLQSLDGGATWAATDGPPPDANQLVLPPDYPRDPRIFAGVSALSPTSTPYLAGSFGAPFRPLTGLPPGQLGLSSHFDAGDPRAFVSSVTGVWSGVITCQAVSQLHQEVADGGMGATSNALSALATPPASSAAVLLIWAPPLATVPGQLASPPSASLLACGVEGACQTTATLPTSPGQLALDDRDGRMVVAYTRTQALVSQDGGQSFAALTVPSGVVTVASAGVSAGAVWLAVGKADESTAVLEERRGGWSEVSQGVALLQRTTAVLTVVGGRHLIAALPDAGYRCMDSDTLAWRPRCDAS